MIKYTGMTGFNERQCSTAIERDTDMSIAILSVLSSVRSSVRLSVTRGYCVKRLSHRRGTARCATSAEILTTAATKNSNALHSPGQVERQ